MLALKTTEVAPILFGETDLNLIPKLADCNPGINPTEYNLIIIQCEASKKIGSIIMSDDTIEHNSAKQQFGRIVRCSHLSFNFDPDQSHAPQAGDIVYYARFAGGEFVGIDGKTYRTIKDKDIIGIIDPAITGE